MAKYLDMRTFPRPCRRDARHSAAAAALLALVVLAAGPAFAAMDPWLTYRNPRHGFQITYPSGLLKPVPGQPETEDGRLFATDDGRVRLLIGVIRNDDGETLQQYREFVMQQTYAGAEFDYAPVGQRWFVLSGTKGEMHFYQWVTFLCAGRRIASWALTYPVSERGELDKVVERMSKTYRPSASSDCG